MTPVSNRGSWTADYSSPRVATTPPVTIATVEVIEPDVEWPEEIPIADSPRVAAITKPEPVQDVAGGQESPQSILPPVGIAISVDHVRASENTYAFRLRWSNPAGVAPKRPAVYFQWVHKSVFDSITEDKEAYGRFKQSIIAQFTEQQKAV